MQRDEKKYESPDGNITRVDQSEYTHESMDYLDNADLINERLEALRIGVSRLPIGAPFRYSYSACFTIPSRAKANKTTTT